MANVAVVLSGCGVFDGSEVYESVLTLLALEENSANYQCFAPDVMQHHVINHLDGTEMVETRNVLIEASRIARGKVKAISELSAEDYDALVFPGGYGAAKNLCDFAIKGIDCEMEPETLKAAKGFVAANKPIGFICISPAMIPLIVGDRVKLTIGNDDVTAATINEMGGSHVNCSVDKIVVDELNKIVSTPAYMLAGNITEAASGIRKLVTRVLEMA